MGTIVSETSISIGDEFVRFKNGSIPLHSTFVFISTMREWVKIDSLSALNFGSPVPEDDFVGVFTYGEWEDVVYIDLPLSKLAINSLSSDHARKLFLDTVVNSGLMLCVFYYLKELDKPPSKDGIERQIEKAINTPLENIIENIKLSWSANGHDTDNLFPGLFVQSFINGKQNNEK